MCARTLADKLFSEDSTGKKPRIPPIALPRRTKHVNQSIEPSPDAIAVMTAYTKSLSDLIYLGAHQFQTSKFYV
jgi:hypothetical protein